MSTVQNLKVVEAALLQYINMHYTAYIRARNLYLHSEFLTNYSIALKALDELDNLMGTPNTEFAFIRRECIDPIK